MKLTNKNQSGTSFHGDTIFTTPQKLINLLGQPQCFDNSGRDKTNMDWCCETDEGDIFTIYDWKEYRKLKMENKYEFHIGGFDREITSKIGSKLRGLL